MSTWLIEPRDPLITRDGRPFGPSPGARARSLPFPLPSTLAGAIRTRAGQNADGAFDDARIPALRNLSVRGPLLVECNEGEALRFMAPAPADALLLEQSKPKNDGNGKAARKWLTPLKIHPAAQCGWPAGNALEPVGSRRPSPAKPLSGAPSFWHWEEFERWLLEPADGPVLLSKLGHGGAVEEARMHVRIDAATQAAAEGMLFQTAGREFTRIRPPAPADEEPAKSGAESEPATEADWLPAARRLADAVRLGLACAIEAPQQEDVATIEVQEGVATLGGERRLVQWRKAQIDLPECPPQVRATIVQQRACRLLLLTPAYFADGFLPTWLLTAAPGVTATIVGAALGRFQGVSGWDLEKKQPKEARKLAPAGAVYFLKLDGTPQAIDGFVTKMWMQCVSDDFPLGNPNQNRLDGFGLATLGVWDGNLQTMEVTDATGSR